MLFASSFMTDFVLTIAFFMWFVAFFGKRWLAKNPDVKDAANNAAKNSALSLISKLFRR